MSEHLTAYGTTCWFRSLGYTGCRYRADGKPDRAHLVPQQRIRHVGEKRNWPPSKIATATWDARVIVPACRAHHGCFDAKSLRLTAEQFPDEMHAWAEEHGFYYDGPRRGWVGEFQPQEAA